MEGGGAVFVVGVGVGPGVQERGDDGGTVVAPGRPMEGGEPPLVSRIRIGSGVQQHGDYSGVSVALGCRMKGGEVIFVLRVGIGPSLQERGDDGGTVVAPGCPMERSKPPLGSRIRIGSGVKTSCHGLRSGGFEKFLGLPVLTVRGAGWPGCKEEAKAPNCRDAFHAFSPEFAPSSHQGHNTSIIHPTINRYLGYLLSCTTVTIKRIHNQNRAFTIHDRIDSPGRPFL